jgi:hypothetical protein
MSNNDEKKLGKSEYFELREKRLKLVYRILYVIVAIWVASFISIGTQEMTTEIAPMYAFLLAASSLLIINIIKYSLMEFRCMKVVGNIEESLLKQTEERYDNIWKSFSVILSLNALFMLLHMLFSSVFNTETLTVIFCVCILYFLVWSFIELFKKKFKDITIRIFDIVGLVVGAITAYSICSIMCLVMIK